MSNRRFGKFDYFVVIILLSSAFGNIGGSLQINRILAIIFIPQLLVHVKKYFHCLKVYMAFSVFVIVYGIVSLMWTPSVSEGIKDIIYFIVHFLLFFEIIVFSKLAKNPLMSISSGCLTAIILTLIVAFWEIITDNHLPMSVQESNTVIHSGREMIIRQFASVTFGNYNGYVTYLCFLLPFVFYDLIPLKKTIRSIISMVTVLLSVIVITFNASRGGILCFTIMLIVYFYMQRKKIGFIITLMTFVLTSIFIISYFNENLFSAIAMRLIEQGFEDSSRIEIWEVTFKALLETFGFGTGMGGLGPWMKSIDCNIINAPHNFFLELFAQLGVIIGLIFTVYVLKLYTKVLKIKELNIKIPVLIALVTLPIASIINSGYLFGGYLFTYFASIIVFIKYNHNPYLVDSE